jgi:hypothetical protein
MPRGAALLAVMLSGCSSGGSDEPLAQDTNSLTFETEEFMVPPGDVFECFYTSTFSDRDLAVYEANGLQAQGGHHIMVFYTDVPRDPQHHPCDDSEMVNWHQIAGSAGPNAGGAVLRLEDNLAIKVPKGKQFVLQAHYINTTGKEYAAKDTVTLQLRPPDELSGYVNYFVINDDDFEIPAHAKHTSTSYCTVPQDLSIVLSLGHQHEEGKRYLLEEIDPAGKLLRTLRDDAWEPEFTSHPPIDYYPLAEPLELKKGTLLRQTCEWDNKGAEPLIFPREMCVGFSYYYPANGDITCDTTSTMK